MKIRQGSTKTLYFKPEKLDQIICYYEDHSPGKGMITLVCYGEAWSCYWGSMGNENLIEFFLSADTGYLANKLWNHTYPQIDTDYDKLNDIMVEADPDFYEDVSNAYMLGVNQDAVSEVLGNEWWEALPTKDVYQYDYLKRIVDATKEAFKELEKVDEETNKPRDTNNLEKQLA